MAVVLISKALRMFGKQELLTQFSAEWIEQVDEAYLLINSPTLLA